MRRFICGRHEELLYGFLPEKGETLAQDSIRMCGAEGWGWIRMPVYPLLEGKILGANIRESEAGAWSGSPLETLPANPKFEGKDADMVLDAIRIAAASGKPVVMDIKGALGVMESLLGTTDIYRRLRKDDPYLKEINDALIEWGRQCVKAGARIISLADNLATCDIIGGKNFKAHFWPLLKELIDGLMDVEIPPTIFLCGKLSQDLLDLGLVRIEELPLATPASLDVAVPMYPGMLLGWDCIHDSMKPREVLYRLVFTEE